MAEAIPSADGLHRLLVKLLAGATKSPAARWEQLVEGIDLHSLATHPRCNWSVRAAAIGQDAESIGHAARLVREAHPYVRR